MEEKKIYTAINAIMAEIGAIKKESKNAQQGFMFRGIDQVMNTLKPLLAKHGVFVVPEVVETKREERVSAKGSSLYYTLHTIKYHFTATDGSEVTATVVGEGMDSADKSSNKAMAVAFKYACFQLFCIPTIEMAKDDPDLYSPDPSMSNILRNLNSATSTDELALLWDSMSESEQAQYKMQFTQAKVRIQTNLN